LLTAKLHSLYVKDPESGILESRCGLFKQTSYREQTHDSVDAPNKSSPVSDRPHQGKHQRSAKFG